MNSNQTAVYEEFARSIPGFKLPPSGETIAMPPISKPLYEQHGILSSEVKYYYHELPIIVLQNKYYATLSLFN